MLAIRPTLPLRHEKADRFGSEPTTPERTVTQRENGALCQEVWILLPVVFLPWLAFGDSKYVGPAAAQA